jgi:hypothetical protein
VLKIKYWVKNCGGGGGNDNVSAIGSSGRSFSYYGRIYFFSRFYNSRASFYCEVCRAHNGQHAVQPAYQHRLARGAAYRVRVDTTAGGDFSANCCAVSSSALHARRENYLRADCQSRGAPVILVV